jgi:hypothetical protein
MHVHRSTVHEAMYICLQEIHLRYNIYALLQVRFDVGIAHMETDMGHGY